MRITAGLQASAAAAVVLAGGSVVRPVPWPLWAAWAALATVAAWDATRAAAQ